MADELREEEIQDNTPKANKSLTPVFFIGTFVWFALFAIFIVSIRWNWGDGWTITMLTVTVAGPPFFYNFFMWLGENENEGSFKSRLAASAKKGAEVWGPFWVAVGAICLAVYAGGCS